MRFTYFIGIFLLLLVFNSRSFSQELNCEVRVTSPKLQTADPKVIKDLEQAVGDFMNSQQWTNDIFNQEEQIRCNLQINITEDLSSTSFKCDIALQAVRPVFGSSYETPLITHVDKDVTFTFEQFNPLEKSTGVFFDNLSSVLSFYAYLMIGLDYDSFAPLGGEEHFQTALNIVNTIPPNVASQNKGWRSLDGNRNRYWIIENILNPKVRPLRQAMYNYHRKSLDLMHKDTDNAKSAMLVALEDISNVNRSYPNAMILQMFANAKGSEVVEIFKQADSKQQIRVYQIMSRIDPANISKYTVLRS